MESITTKSAYALALRNLNATQGRTRAGEPNLATFGRSAFRAETIRLALWACSAGGTSRVFTTRLVNIAAPLLRPQARGVETTKLAHNKVDNYEHADQEPEVIALDTLDELEKLGDLSRLHGGFWVPAPIRFVKLESVNKWILLGGRPTRELPMVLRQAVEYSGVARLVKPLPGAMDLPFQSQEAWCRVPNGHIEEWTTDTLNKSDLTAFDDPEAEFEFYAPGVEKIRNSRSSLQYYRWTGSDGLPNGKYLIRSRSRFVGIRYRIGEVNKGELVATGSLDLEDGDVRRLQYGLDALADCPVAVESCQTHENWQFLLKNELPMSETRLLRALGKIRLRADGGYYPQLLTIQNNLVVQAIRAFDGLRITIKRVDKFKKTHEFARD